MQDFLSDCLRNKFATILSLLWVNFVASVSANFASIHYNGPICSECLRYKICYYITRPLCSECLRNKICSYIILVVVCRNTFLLLYIIAICRNSCGLRNTRPNFCKICGRICIFRCFNKLMNYNWEAHAMSMVQWKQFLNLVNQTWSINRLLPTNHGGITWFRLMLTTRFLTRFYQKYMWPLSSSVQLKCGRLSPRNKRRRNGSSSILQEDQSQLLCSDVIDVIEGGSDL